MNATLLHPQPGRRVRHLHIRASAEDEARRAAILLGDALHTATMPFSGQGKMLVVRRLALGRIAAQGSAATLALQVERAMREVAVSAVPFDLPAARHANAVIFSSRAEALAMLARRHARGVVADEWFWPTVVKAWSAGLSRGERWCALLEAAHSLPEAALAAAAVVEEAWRTGVEDELFSAVPPGSGAAWLRLAGWSGTLIEGAGMAAPFLSARYEEIARRWQRRWGPVSERLVWVAVMFAVIERPVRAADPHLPARAARWLASACEDAGVKAAEQPASSETLASADDSAARHEPHEFTDSAAIRSEDSREEKLAVTSPAPEAPEDAPPQNFASRAGGFTPCAGFLFLVPILERLGFADFLAAHPMLLEGGFPARLLFSIGQRVGLRPDDPLALALDEFDPAAPEPLLWEMPSPAREILAPPAPRLRLASPLAAWWMALRRWCRREAHIGLASLIYRPGFVAVSRTHFDVTFDLATADLRVRRSALDVDPGWVPWLGRVVRFHYVESHELPG